MSAKGSSSQVIQPNQYIAPQDLNILLKGTMYQEELAKNNLQELKSSYNQLASLPAFGKDAEVLQGRLEELKNQVSGMKLGSLNDFNTKAQINGIINEFGKDKKLNDIAKRWTPYVQELKKKEKADAEGKLYISPLLDDAQEYIQNNESIEGKRFGSSGWIAADFDKELEGALKNVQKVKKVIKVGNYNQEVESYDDNDLQTTLKSFYERPDIDRDIQYKINKAAKNQNIDWSEKGAFTLQKQLNDANNLLLIDPTSTEARRFIETNAQFLEQPEKLAQIARNQYVSEEKNKEIASKIAAKQYESYGKLEADAFKLKAVDHINRLNEDIFKLKLKTGLSQNPGESQSAYIQRLADKAQESDLEIAQAKLNMKTEAQKEMEDVKQEDRIEIAKIKSEKDRLKDAEKLPEYTLDEVRSKYKTSSNFNTNIKSLLKDKGLDLSSIGGFNESDIEAITPDKKNGEYMVSIDTDVFGQPTLIRITAQELDNLMNGKKHNENNLETNSNKQEGTIYDGIDENGNPKFK